MMPEDEISSSYEPSPEVACYARAVIETWPEKFDYLGECYIGYFTTGQEIKMKGKVKSGYAMIPNVRGQEGYLFRWAMTRLLGYNPDALVVFDRYFWGWAEENKAARVVGVYHKLLHLEHKHTGKGAPCFSVDTSRPVLQIRDHDIEEFVEVGEMFGAWHEGIEEFVRAVRSKEGKYPDLPKVVELAEQYCKAFVGGSVSEVFDIPTVEG